MINELDTYSLSDFMPMEADVYLRLFVRLNELVWPGQFVTLGMGLLILWMLVRNRVRVAGLLLGVAWFSSGYFFHLHFFAELNWVAVYFGWAFIFQGLLLVFYGVIGWLKPRPAREWTVLNRLGALLMAVALVGYPLLMPITGRGWKAMEVFALAPDPTTLFTFGFLLINVGLNRTLWIIPIAWSLLSGATWYAL